MQSETDPFDWYSHLRRVRLPRRIRGRRFPKMLVRQRPRRYSGGSLSDEHQVMLPLYIFHSKDSDSDTVNNGGNSAV